MSVFVSSNITRSTSVLVYGFYFVAFWVGFSRLGALVFKPVTCAGLTCSFRSGGKLSKAIAPSGERKIATLIILKSLWRGKVRHIGDLAG